jgi:hypothetical protein
MLEWGIFFAIVTAAAGALWAIETVLKRKGFFK